MNTEDLINSLVIELRPASRWHIAQRLVVGVGVGVAASIALLFALMGPRHDLMEVLATGAFWTKATFTLSMAAASLFIVSHLARPEQGRTHLWFLAVPVLAYLPLGIDELVRTAPADWGPMLFGHGWRHCTWLIFGLSVPIFFGLCWAFRQFAPTRLELAGAMAGICSGAVAAVVYCLHCPTDAAVFALTWYTLAFILAGGAGAFLGRRLLDW
jgi:hypothetical protein